MLTIFCFILVVLLGMFAIEDFILDLIAWFNKLKPKRLTEMEWVKIKALPEKNVAIMVANWQEANVIARMIKGNIQRIDYKHCHFFIGVYPNDHDTIEEAKKVESEYPHQVHVIVNHLQGPTSKGQMLNQIIQGVFRHESILKTTFDIFLMHDSEDILHPRSLSLINSECDKADFLQTPIFSFQRKAKEWVGSTYVDEFAELHTKDLLVRKALGAPVPSAGVGTAISRPLMLTLMKNNNGNFLNEESLTEDYVLGMSASGLGFRSQFCCYYFINQIKQKELIATREYFPKHLHAAVRQKSRWVFGIVFQGSLLIPWSGSLSHKYYLLRDRRGPIVNLVSFLSLLVTLWILLTNIITKYNPAVMD
jgi:adsorption protein B